MYVPYRGVYICISATYKLYAGYKLVYAYIYALKMYSIGLRWFEDVEGLRSAARDRASRRAAVRGSS